MKKEIFASIFKENIDKNWDSILSRDISLPKDIFKIVTLVGSRRSGKTCIMFDLIHELRKKNRKEFIVYFNFEDDRIFPMYLEEMDLWLETYYGLFPEAKLNKVYFFLDEIQEIPHWEKFIRRIYDTENCRIYLTGSSSRLLSSDIPTSLRGRCLTYKIFPLSFKEYLRFNKITPDLYLSKNRAKVKFHLNRYLLHGGYPELIQVEEGMISKILQEYLDLIMYKDLVERYSVSNIFLLKLLVRFCISNISNLISVNKIYQDFKSQGLSVSRNTLFDYFSMLEDAFLIFPVQKHSISIRNQWRNPRKIYINDQGFHPLVSTNSDFGRILENTVFLNLFRNSDKINYFSEQHEIDFIVSVEKNKLLLNVCYDISHPLTLKREVEGLLEGMKYFDIKTATIITSSEERTIKEGNYTISIIPVWKWLLSH